MPATPLPFPQAYRESDPRDPFEMRVGVFHEPIDPGDDPHVVLIAEAKHCNTGGGVHGGLLMTMADLALCAAARAGFPDERAVTVSLNADFLAGALPGDVLIARGEVVRRTGRLCFVRGLITAVSDDAPEPRTVLSASAVTRRVKRT